MKLNRNYYEDDDMSHIKGMSTYPERTEKPVMGKVVVGIAVVVFVVLGVIAAVKYA
ncbi:MAG TPA: hypothetical protein VD884_13375 [Ohtaekwangia sp.]|nr:hypothetical protein [Ohtaekwangia sp.]